MTVSQCNVKSTLLERKQTTNPLESNANVQNNADKFNIPIKYYQLSTIIFTGILNWIHISIYTISSTKRLIKKLEYL